MFWSGKSVIVTGGASFIGSHLTEKLVKLGSKVQVIDNLSSGKKEFIQPLIDSKKIVFNNLDLEYTPFDEIKKAFKNTDVVFHLANIHGGRGYIDTHPADVSSNFAIDHHTLEAAYSVGVDRFAFASSACVYPPSLQEKYDSDYLLKEEDTDIRKLKEPLSADLEYGWAKLMGEVQLNSFIKQYGFKGTSLRFVTAYGERENESHAIIALIYKAAEEMNPFEIWGTGEQSRDFTYVSDIVDGTVLAAEKITDGTPINLGTGVRYKLKDVANMIFENMDYHPKVVFDVSKPTGVVSRALSIDRANNLLGWKPKVSLKEGLARTIEWYIKSHKKAGEINDRVLFERS